MLISKEASEQIRISKFVIQSEHLGQKGPLFTYEIQLVKHQINSVLSVPERYKTTEVAIQLLNRSSAMLHDLVLHDGVSCCLLSVVHRDPVCCGTSHVLVYLGSH